MATVLVVDDALYVRHVVGEMLAGAGHTMLEAADGDEALRHFRESKPDVTLLDLVLPNKTGLQVLKEIRRESPGAVVLVLSAGATESNVREAIAGGATGFLTKPLERERLLEAIQDALP
jgi:two-component system chemotaxis response regulator CheY